LRSLAAIARFLLRHQKYFIKNLPLERSQWRTIPRAIRLLGSGVGTWKPETPDADVIQALPQSCGASVWDAAAIFLVMGKGWIHPNAGVTIHSSL
jgi:hypothetical protein